MVVQKIQDKIASEEIADEKEPDEDETSLDAIRIGKSSGDAGDTFEYIAIGNSVTCNVIDETLWWGEWGMAATAPEKDYVHLIMDWLEENAGQQVSSTVLNLKPWELAEDRSKVLNEYKDFFHKDVELITIQTGENITEYKENLEKDYMELISMIKEKAPNAQILVLGEVLWPSEDIEEAKKAACEELNLTFVDMTFFLNNYEAMYRSKIGATVNGADGEEHKIENEVVAAHPNNQGMQVIAEEVTKHIDIGTNETLESDTEMTTASSVESEFQRISNLPAGELAIEGMLSGELIEQLFYSTEIDEAIFSRINGVSYKENDSVKVEDLRYLRMLCYDVDGNTYVGEMIVNQKIADTVLEIFQTLYENQYPIERMVLVDEYQADDESSMAANNTSAFNYRSIAGSSTLSKHSYGMAIDINPRYNPYVKTAADGSTVCQPADSMGYADRSEDFIYKIDENDLAYKLFTEAGFTWGGSWNSLKDYQHFEMAE